MSNWALITGGAGFIGSHIADAYRNLGYKIMIVDDLSRSDGSNIQNSDSFLKCDFAADNVLDWIRQNQPEVVSHQAAQMEVTFSVKNPAKDAEINILSTLKLLETLASINTAKFIFASTGGAMFGDGTPLPAKVNMEAKPESPYGIAKLTVENYLRFYSNTKGLKNVVLRYANVYGPRQTPHGEAGVVAIFFNAIAKQKRAKIFGDGSQTRDYVFVEDVVRANLLALDIDEGLFHIGTGKEVDLNTLTSKIFESTGLKYPHPLIEYTDFRPGELKRSSLDISKSTETLGFEPQFNLSEGIKKTKEYFLG